MSEFPSKKNILIFSKTKKLVAIVNSINDAAKIAKVKPNNIVLVCKGKIISLGTYYFRYIDENIEIEFSDLGKLDVQEYDKLCGVVRYVYPNAKMNTRPLYKKRKDAEKDKDTE